MGTIIGIDVGGSTTKIVGFRADENGVPRELISPQFVRATDPITSIYGALGKFTLQNGLSLSDIDRVMMTGVGSSYVEQPIYSLDCRPVPEFGSVGIGGLYLSGLDEAIVVSMGTGTAIIHAKKNESGVCDIEYMGGTGVGGGTLIGLSKKMLGIDTVEHIEQICENGDLSNIDLRIKDLSKTHKYPGMNEELTASNFGKLSDIASKHDIALGIVNMVAETIATTSIFAARAHKLKDIVLTGNLSIMPHVRAVFENLAEPFGVRFIIPEDSQFGTVIGAALHPVDNY
ncbi:MAG: type II pantothenate kinase [Ruminococcaceae bacterium]|nr:type II pantothenate kinase [Oscillospiraceae bacterium]